MWESPEERTLHLVGPLNDETLSGKVSRRRRPRRGVQIWEFPGIWGSPGLGGSPDEGMSTTLKEVSM